MMTLADASSPRLPHWRGTFFQAELVPFPDSKHTHCLRGTKGLSCPFPPHASSTLLFSQSPTSFLDTEESFFLSIPYVCTQHCICSRD